LINKKDFSVHISTAKLTAAENVGTKLIDVCQIQGSFSYFEKYKDKFDRFELWENIFQNQTHPRDREFTRENDDN
jgi:hypothetical protein